MKKELLTMLASSALFAYSANAEIVLTEDLSVSGYIDAAITDAEGEANTATSVAEFELGFSFTPAESPWSALAELSFDDSVEDNNNPADFEKVMITYAYSDTLSFTTGNMLTYQGFEAADATGLYQFSYQGIGGGAVYSALMQLVLVLIMPLTATSWAGGSAGTKLKQMLAMSTMLPTLELKT